MNANNYKISVIMPIYNAEKYLERSINSIINQSIGFENIELILINDNSTDSTKEIMEKYSNDYSNIKTFHSTENHGYPGYGRNIGLKNSTANYIMFIDNDDEYFPQYCETMYNTITQNDIDVVSSNFKIIKKESVKDNIVFEKVINDENIHFISKDLENGKCIISLNEFYYLRDTEVWNKIFKKDIIAKNNINFIETALNEDTMFLYNYYECADKLMNIDFYGYKWYRDGENLSYHSTNATLKFIYSFYDIFEFTKKSSQEIDLNKLFSFHIEESLINCLFIPTKDITYVLRELYKFEKIINFTGKLKYSWNNIINKFVLKNQLHIAKILLIIMREGRLIYKKLF